MDFPVTIMLPMSPYRVTELQDYRITGLQNTKHNKINIRLGMT